MRRERCRGPTLTLPHPSQEHLDEGECLPPAVLRKQQEEKLFSVLEYAYRWVPFYRGLWQRLGLHPRKIKDLADFSSLVPRVRKDDLIQAIREEGSGRVGLEALRGARPSNIVMTSGSRGFNTFAFLSPGALLGDDLLTAARELWAMKVRPGLTVLTLGPAWHVLALRDSLALGALGATVVSPWGSYAPRFYPAFLDAVMTFQPQHLLVTAPVLRGMLAECHRRGLPPVEAFRSVFWIGCAGEAITPLMRQWLKDEMALEDLFERGGSSDGMFGGPECFVHWGHHISADAHYVEVIDPLTGMPCPPGRRGLVVVTNLSLGRSLYIRFETGDVGELRWAPCPCGRTSPLLELYGRWEDCALVDGRIITPYDVRCILDKWEELRWARVSVRWHKGCLYVDIEGVGPSREVLEEASRSLREELQGEVCLSLRSEGVEGWKGQRMLRPSS